ncbi:MAG: excisionase family DNA-binding protein [Lachnospiraceae bacterium]|nr:excisionase family DNA-binding protein [Lachnospiraceae bacterium]
MITITQAAAETGLSYDHLRKLCLRGEIVHVKAGRKFLINKEKLIGFLNNGEP